MSDAVLPSATDVARKVDQFHARRAAEAEVERSHQDEERRRLIDELAQPLEPTPEVLERVARRIRTIIDATVTKGERRALLFRFPNELTTDHGRAINVREPGWERTLSGRPRQLFEYWETTLKPLGYGLSAEIVDFPGGMPGDVGLFLSWD